MVAKKPAVKRAVKSMLSAPLYDLAGKEIGTVPLPVEFFAVEGPTSLLTQYVRVYRANQRQGTSSSKTRSEVVGSTRKIYKQKGTGRARHGARKAPIFVGGGVAFGPRLADHSLSLTKKQRTRALFMSLSAKLADNGIIVIEKMSTLPPKTKSMSLLLKALKFDKKVLLVHAHEGTDGVVMSARNIKNILLREAKILNAYDAIYANKIVFAKEALDEFLEFRNPKNEN